MNPIDSSKKWILNKLVPLIERQEKAKTREEDLVKNGRNPISKSSGTSKQDENVQYSDLLEDSEYPKK